MQEELIIHIDWDGPYTQQESALLHSPTDFGIYQVYGAHPVYGGDTLLYIGIACDRTFGQRIPEHGWCQWTRNPANVTIHVGRLSGCTTPDHPTWSRWIKLAERLLIYSHYPVYNTQKQLAGLERDLWHVHVLNWKHHRDLMAEVSGARWTSRFDIMEGYHSFSNLDRASTGTQETEQDAPVQPLGPPTFDGSSMNSTPLASMQPSAAPAVSEVDVDLLLHKPIQRLV